LALRDTKAIRGEPSAGTGSINDFLVSTVLYLLLFLLLGVVLRRMFERGRKLAELRARVAALEAEQASQDRVT